MGDLHASLATFARTRRNPLGVEDWPAMLARCGRDMDAIAPGLFDRVERALVGVIDAWPSDLPVAAIHSDLFPDNVLMLGMR